MHTVLSLETSCDETAVSLVQYDAEKFPSKLRVLSQLIHSQTAIHLPFGGVVPEVASRDHLAKIGSLTKQCIGEFDSKLIDAVAVTMGPGLIGPLMVGVLFARGLAASLGCPLLGINHIDAHLAPTLLIHENRWRLSEWMEIKAPEYPALSLTASGGHCHLSFVKSATDRVVIGRTLDDACGEAFDKVAKLLGLDYPGGPQLELLASLCETEMPWKQFKMPATLADKSRRYDFSFSGLKTSVIDVVRREIGQKQGNFGKADGTMLAAKLKSEIACAFQFNAINQLIDRIQNAVDDHPGEFKTLLIAGGVAANQTFRTRLAELSLPVRVAPKILCSDNATMIAMQAVFASNNGFEHHAFPRY